MLAFSQRSAPPLAVQAAARWQVDVVSTDRDFLALEPAWTQLSGRALVDHPFSTFGWMRAWWEAFGAGHELHIVVAREDGEVAAIAPMMITRGRLFGLPIRRLESMANDQTPRFEFLVARGSSGAYDAIWQHLQRKDARWDLLQLVQLPAESATMHEIARLAGEAELPVGRWNADASPYLVFEGADVDTYRRTISKKHRGNVERLMRRLEESGPVELEILSTPAEVAGALEDGFRLEGSGWKNQAGTAILSLRPVEAFYRSLVAYHASTGQLRLLFLKSCGERIAFAYGVRRGNDLYLLKCGYDPEFARVAPVHLLCHLLFRDARVRGLGLVEFLGANDAWKQRWTHRAIQHVWLYVFRDAWWTRLLCRTKFELVPHLKQRAVYRALFSRMRGRAVAAEAALQPSEG